MLPHFGHPGGVVGDPLRSISRGQASFGSRAAVRCMEYVRQPSSQLARDVAVRVDAGQTARIDVRFTPAEVTTPSR